MVSGIIFDIQKFSFHDGPGIRTTVFMKGCPLDCVWCHNPESRRDVPEVLFDAEKCSYCRRCVTVCPNMCHKIKGGKHLFDRGVCSGCGLCAAICFSDALELCGVVKSADEVMAEVMRDKPFYDNSGGGMTLSGGEPMAQFGFTKELLKLGKENGLHICMETCGFAPWKEYEEIMSSGDRFLFDIKTADKEKHLKFTGQDNTIILQNLQNLNEHGAKIHLRCPLIEGVNDSDAELRGIGKLANSLSNVREVDIEPYHPLGIQKAKRLGIGDMFEGGFTPQTVCDKWVDVISQNTSKTVVRQ